MALSCLPPLRSFRLRQQRVYRRCFRDTGQISVSVDGDGNNDASIGGLIEVNKPAGATVRKAFLMANSHGVFGTRVINDGDVSLAGVPVAWNISLFNGNYRRS